MLIQELFNRPLPLTWEQSPGYIRAHFDVDGKEGMVKFYYEGGIWTVDFFIDDRHDITGLGDEFEIFGTVLQAIRQFVNSKHPDLVAFSAREPSRARLYRRLIPRLFPDYEIDAELSKQTGFGLKSKDYKPFEYTRPGDFPG